MTSPPLPTRKLLRPNVTQQAFLWIGALVCLVGALAIILAAGLPDRASYSGLILADGQVVAPEIGALAPPIRAATLDGTIDLADLRGTPVLINFWATWCIPCRVEMPELQALHEAQPSIPILAVNLGESPDQIVDWVTQLGLTYTVVLDPQGAVASDYRLRGQPSTYVISPGGAITNIFYGPATLQALEAALEPLQRN